MQVFVSPGEGIAQLLADVRAGIVHREGIYSYALVAGQCLHGLHEGLQGLGIFANLLTLADELVDGVIVDRTAQHFEVVALGGEVVDEDIGELHALALAGDEVELYAACADTLEQCLDTFGREHLALDLESERVGTALHGLQCLGIGLGIVGHLNVLTHTPFVVVFLVAAHEGVFARQCIGSSQ